MIPVLEQLARRTPLGWLQLRHDKMRLLVSIGGIVFADVLMFMQLGILCGLYDANTMFHHTVNADVLIISTQAQQLANMSTFSRRRLYQALDVPGVKEVRSAYIDYTPWRNPDTKEKTTMLLVGFDPADKSFTISEVLAGADKLKLADHIMFDRASRGDYRKAIEAVQSNKIVRAEIGRRSLEIAGSFVLGASFATDGALFMSDATFLRVFPKRTAGEVSLGLVRLTDGANPNDVVKGLNARLPADVRAVTKEGFVNFEKHYLDTTSPISLVFGMGTVIGFMIGAVLVYQILSTDVNDHMSEYATFKAIGFPNTYLYGVLAEETLILSSIGFLPGVLAAHGLYYMLRTLGSLPIYMPVSRLVLVYVLTVLMCAVAAYIASRKLRAADPAEIF